MYRRCDSKAMHLSYKRFTEKRPWCISVLYEGGLRFVHLVSLIGSMRNGGAMINLTDLTFFLLKFDFPLVACLTLFNLCRRCTTLRGGTISWRATGGNPGKYFFALCIVSWVQKKVVVCEEKIDFCHLCVSIEDFDSMKTHLLAVSETLLKVLLD